MSNQQRSALDATRRALAREADLPEYERRRLALTPYSPAQRALIATELREAHRRELLTALGRAASREVGT